jgi:hypothetical protein
LSHSQASSELMAGQRIDVLPGVKQKAPPVFRREGLAVKIAR